jgi:hypothetical protein
LAALSTGGEKDGPTMQLIEKRQTEKARRAASGGKGNAGRLELGQEENLLPGALSFWRAKSWRSDRVAALGVPALEASSSRQVN